MKYKVLWIEDGALVHLAELVGPVYRSGRFDLTIELNAADGVARLRREHFDVLIVDIRIPPGENKDWITLFQDRTRGAEARLGLELLKVILGSPEARIKVDASLDWIRADMIAVFTVENWHELERDMSRLGIRVFQVKNSYLQHTVLVDLIEEVITNMGAAGRGNVR